jgi:Protein of unknown function (DUF2384)
MIMTGPEYIKAYFTELYRILPTPCGRDFSHSLSLGADGEVEIRLNGGDWYKIAISILDPDPRKAAQQAAQANCRWPDAHIQHLIETASRMLGERLGFSWMNEPLPELSGRCPIDAAQTLAGARHVELLLIERITDPELRAQTEWEIEQFYARLTSGTAE